MKVIKFILDDGVEAAFEKGLAELPRATQVELCDISHSQVPKLIDAIQASKEAENIVQGALLILDDKALEEIGRMQSKKLINWAHSERRIITKIITDDDSMQTWAAKNLRQRAYELENINDIGHVFSRPGF